MLQTRGRLVRISLMHLKIPPRSVRFWARVALTKEKSHSILPKADSPRVQKTAVRTSPGSEPHLKAQCAAKAAAAHPEEQYTGSTPPYESRMIYAGLAMSRRFVR